MFDEHGMGTDVVLEELWSFLDGDSTYTSGHPVASMSTIPHSLGMDVFVHTLEKNAGRLHTFKGSAEVEYEVLDMIGDLLQLKDPYGTSTSGGTESNILAMLAARQLAKRKTKQPEAIAPKTIHSSVDKAAWLLGVKLVKTRVDKQFKSVPKAVGRAITKNTIGIFATAGTTYLGQIDPIYDIGKIANEHKLPFHVDAAFGGFVIPFLNELDFGSYDFDFAVKGVTSISVDPHKMGLAPIPMGSIIFRNRRLLKSITTKIPYLRGASATQSSILGTRPASPILATWAIMKHLGREGYRKIVSQCMTRTEMAVERIMDNPMLSLAIKPVMNILGIRSKEVPLDLVVKRMEKRGWRMATSPIPPTLRIVVMPHVTEGALNAFLNDLDYVATTIPAD